MNIKFEDTKLVRVEFQRHVTESVNLLVPDSLDETEVEDMVRTALYNALITPEECTPECEEISHYSVTAEFEMCKTKPQNLFRSIVYIDTDDEIVVRDIRFDEQGNEVIH